jgi:VPDSG-CTERM motif
MNKIKYIAVVLISIAGLGLQQAKADVITFVGQFTSANQDPGSILAVANANGVDSFGGDDMDLSVDVRLTSSTTSVTNSFGTFSFTQTATGTELVSFDIASGFVLAGIAIHDGSGNVDNYYSVNDETFGTLEGPVVTPNAGNGLPGGLSNLDFLLEPSGATVPDGGTTVMLLGAGLSGLGLVRRFLKR